MKKFARLSAAALLLAGSAVMAGAGSASAATTNHFDVYANDGNGHITAHGWADAVWSGDYLTLNSAGIKDDRADGYGTVLQVYAPWASPYDLTNHTGSGTITRDSGSIIGPSSTTYIRARACRLSSGHPVDCGPMKYIYK